MKGCFGYLLFAAKETFFLIIFREGGKGKIDGGGFESLQSLPKCGARASCPNKRVTG